MKRCPPCTLNCAQGDECPHRLQSGEAGSWGLLAILLLPVFSVILATIAAVAGMHYRWW